MSSESESLKRPIDAISKADDEEEKSTAEGNVNQPEPPKRPRYQKKKVAMLIGYSGDGYYGLQRNPTDKDHRTIEDEFVEAMVKVDAITEEHARYMNKMSFQRAARTDKGVSAAGNLFSLKMVLIPDVVEKINKLVPPQMKVYDVLRTTGSFNSKIHCDSRTYMYLLPTLAFCPVEEITTEAYRMSEEVLLETNSLLAEFKGTRNYHNFTVGKKFTDPSSKRYIMSAECGRPFVRDGMEFAVITIHGQSFMMHQIRKMIGFIIAVVRGLASKENLQMTWGADKVDVPKAPSLGLMLDKLHYDKYSRKYCSDGSRTPIDWSRYQEEMERFKHEFIYPTVVKKEKEEKSMMMWLRDLHRHHFGVLVPGYPPGAYTGIGRAMHLIELQRGTEATETAKEQRNTSSEESDGEGDGDGDGEEPPSK